MTKGQTVAAGVFGVFALLYLTRPKGTVTTSETFDLDSLGSTGYDAKIKRFAEAVAHAEGFYVGGSVPQRAKNPGDLKLPNSNYTFPNGQSSNVTVFESVDQGWNALYRQLALIVNGQSAYYDLGMSISDMGKQYAEGDLNWGRNVAARLGVTPDTPLWTVLV